MSALQFDGVQRYRCLAEIVSRLGFRPEPSILDVGGGTGSLAAYLQSSRLYTIDPAGGGPRHVRGSMSDLPFPDERFDLVVQIDALEHVPEEARSASLQELARVSSGRLVWMGPVQNAAVVQVEEDLCETHRRLLAGREMEWLAEHRKHGLPDEGGVIEILSGFCEDWATWKSCSLSRWWLLKRFEILLESGPYRPDLQETVDRWYRESGWKSDYRIDADRPAYRRVFVGTRSGRLPEGIDKPVSDELDFSEWRAALPILEFVLPPAVLGPDGLPTSGRGEEVLERLAAILGAGEPREAKPSLLKRLFG